MLCTESVNLFDAFADDVKLWERCPWEKIYSKELWTCREEREVTCLEKYLHVLKEADDYNGLFHWKEISKTGSSEFGENAIYYLETAWIILAVWG